MSTDRVRKDAPKHRLDKGTMGESPARKSIRALKLTAVQSKAIRHLLQPLAESEDLVEGFFQDCAELNAYTALMILEGYEQDGFYKLGSAKALHQLLTTFIQDETSTKTIRHDFSTPVWLITNEKMAKIRERQSMEVVSARSRVALPTTTRKPKVQTEVVSEAEVKPETQVKCPATTGIQNKKAWQNIIKFPGLPKNNP